MGGAELVDACFRPVTTIFPNICPLFLDKLAIDLDFDTNAIINYIVDQEGEGKPYPRKQAPGLKRKRESLAEEAQEVARVKRIYDAEGRRPRILSQHHARQIRDLLWMDFPQIPIITIQAALDAAHNFLLPTYVALFEASLEHANRPWVPCARGPYAPKSLDETIKNCLDPDERDTLLELHTARRAVAERERERRLNLEKDRAEQANFDEALANGFTKECECCFVDFALNRLTQCSADTAHWFCFNCCRRQAETLVGLSKYELTCMSMDGCQASFSHFERQRFLDKKLASALDRAEQDAVLRLAGLEDLVSCPFCPFAAECSPTEVDREFRCQNPECQIVSCRLCGKETHVPKTCEDAAKEHGYSARRTIEEAMSAALIRRCNKCNTPFIKADGCNKMMCTRSACRNVQCYVCSKTCDYAHFNDPKRGGKEGNCPLFDNVETRHIRDISAAEEETRKKVADANPDVDPEHLKFHMSDDVSQDGKRRARPLADAVHIPQWQRARVPEPRVPDAPAAARVPDAAAARVPDVPAAARAPDVPAARMPVEARMPHIAREPHVPRMANNAPGNAGQGRLLVPEPFQNMVDVAHDPHQLPQQRQQYAPRNNLFHFAAARQQQAIIAAQHAALTHRAVMATAAGRSRAALLGVGRPPLGAGYLGANAGVNRPGYDELAGFVRGPVAGRPAHGVYPRPRERPGAAEPMRDVLAMEFGHGRGRSDRRQEPNAAAGARADLAAPPPLQGPMALAVQAASGNDSGRYMAIPGPPIAPVLGHDLYLPRFPPEPQLPPFGWVADGELGNAPPDYVDDALFFGDMGAWAENPQL
ncbi:ring finger protein [Ophiocordyceps sinensis CO18]|uniref:Ring finger protein n=1 Tax=Ophiocordyceps sinensis (strain Co18 / CGMCC 3.14243) TaxID=911162 RepID=T5A1W2_OPHSC|nr:ring finger protein [Ophiocordyceps sinensis CO18]